MVVGRAMWASEAAGLNDRAEVRQGWEKINAWLERQTGDGSVMNLLRRYAADPHRSGHEVFVLCASTRPDDANQWRLYANRGAGYAVELDPAIPLTVRTDKDLASRSSGSLSLSAFGDIVEVGPWMHVIYEDDEIDRAMSALVEAIRGQFESMDAEHLDEEAAESQGESIADEAYRGLAEIAHLIKEPGFSGENEVRIVTTFLLSSKRHIKYRPGAYGILGYAELATRPGQTGNRVVTKEEAVQLLPIKSVRLGPLLDKEHLDSVKSFLQNNEFRDVDVSRSDVPLR